MQTENGFVPCLHEIQSAKKQLFADGHTSVPTSATHLTKEKGFGKHERFLLFIFVIAGHPVLTNCRCATGQRSMIIGCLPGAARFWQSIVKLTDDGKTASLGKTGVILFLNVYNVNRQNTNEVKNDSAV